jgi:hypothetical protein
MELFHLESRGREITRKAHEWEARLRGRVEIRISRKRLKDSEWMNCFFAGDQILKDLNLSFFSKDNQNMIGNAVLVSKFNAL